MSQPFEVGARVVDLHDHHGTVVGYYRDSIKVAWDGGGTSCGPVSHGGLRPEPEPDTSQPRVNICCGHVTCQEVVRRAIEAGEPRKTTMTTYALTTTGREVTVSVEAGKHGGPTVVVRDEGGWVVLAAKAEHVTAPVLGSLFDPGTAATVLAFVAEATR